MDREERRERSRARYRALSGREKGIGLAYLVAILGALLLVLPVTGVVSRDEPDPDECLPDYSKCLDPDASDYDCEGQGDGPSYVTGPMVVTGDDPFGLDPDGNGFACE